MPTQLCRDPYKPASIDKRWHKGFEHCSYVFPNFSLKKQRLQAHQGQLGHEQGCNNWISGSHSTLSKANSKSPKRKVLFSP